MSLIEAERFRKILADREERREQAKKLTTLEGLCDETEKELAAQGFTPVEIRGLYRGVLADVIMSCADATLLAFRINLAEIVRATARCKCDT